VPKRLQDVLDLDDFERAVRPKLPHAVFGYVAHGAETEATLRANRATFDAWRLVTTRARWGQRTKLCAWRHIRLLRELWKGKRVIKGILSPADAALAMTTAESSFRFRCYRTPNVASLKTCCQFPKNQIFPVNPTPICGPQTVFRPSGVNFKLPITPAPSCNVTSSKSRRGQVHVQCDRECREGANDVAGPVGLPCPCTCA
jgi:hypothetical protein